MAAKLNAGEILERAKAARKLSTPCRLCPRSCGVNRIAGEKGYCMAGPAPVIARCLPHFGEEPPISGDGGPGTIFFSRCTMRCVYCQNYQISQGQLGSILTPEVLADQMLSLQIQGCANVEPVSSSHQLPAFLEALALAVGRGLDLPVVYNTNGFESAEVLDLLNGVVNVYLPDLKYSSALAATKYSEAPEYVEFARSAILKMHDHVGNLVVDMQGRAFQGLIVRHLVLPGDISGTEETLRWVRDNLPSTVTLSLMSQYLPMHKAKNFPELNRKITPDEYDRVLDSAWGLGFENVFIQDMQSPEYGTPDFGRDNPFDWNV